MSSPDSSSSQRRANRARVVRALRERGAQSRRTLAEIGLSRSTVTSVVEELIDAGTVVEVAGPTGRPRAPAGRRPWSASRATLGVAVGVEIANGVVRAAVCNTAQELLLHDSVPMDDHTPPEATLKTVGTLIDHMLDRLGLGPGARARRRRRDARPDPAPQRRQRPGHHAQAVGQRQPARRRRRGAPAAAALVDNDANLAALAEITWGAARGLRDVAYVYTASGIGAGFILNGALYVGANGTAGELGHTTIDENGLVCECGGRGCLNTLANADAITPEPVAQPPRPALHRAT